MIRQVIEDTVDCRWRWRKDWGKWAAKTDDEVEHSVAARRGVRRLFGSGH